MKKKLLVIFTALIIILVQIPYAVGVMAASKDGGTAVLTVVDSTDPLSEPSVIINKSYKFKEGATLKDLFEAAKEAGDIDDYSFSYGYISSITPKGAKEIINKADFSSYWASYKNGAYAQGASDCTEGDILSDGVSFEFSWENYPSVTDGLSEDEWKALSAQAEEGTAAALGNEYPAGINKAVAQAERDADTEKTFQTLYSALLEKASGEGGWAALCLAAAGKTGADKDAVLSAAKDAYSAPSGTNLQSSILILSAAGIDPASVDIEGGEADLIQKLFSTPSAIGGWAESPAYTLLAYGANPGYGIPSQAPNSPEKLIALLKDTYQCPGGGFGWGGSFSADTTGAVLAALSCYSDSADAAEMIDKAVSALMASQNDDGGFGYADGAETNADSTALAIIGLCAAGIDPAGSSFTKNGATAVSALLSFADSTGTGLDLPEGTDKAYTESDVLRALAAYSGFTNTGSAYNIYTMAAEGKAACKAPAAPEEETTTQGGTDSAANNKNSNSSKSPSTGDNYAAVFMAAMLAVSLCAISGILKRKQ